MGTWETIQDWLFSQSLSWVFNYLLSILVTLTVYMGYKRWRWGGWNVIVTGDDGERLVERDVSIKKAEELEDDSELSVFVKGICSPYRQLNFDVIVVGKPSGFLTIDKKERNIYIDLRKCPKKDTENPASPR